jgi:ribosome biogenesis GTPase
MAKPKRKIRADFRKNRTYRTRRTDLTREFQRHGLEGDETPGVERVSGKGDLSRRRTVVASEVVGDDMAGLNVRLEVDESVCRPGRVLTVMGLMSVVEGDDGRTHRCAVRRLLKTLSTDQRHVVAAGDRVLFRAVASSGGVAGIRAGIEGIVERIEPRHACIAREVKGRQHVMVANVDQAFIISSAAEPQLKPNLVDRLIVAVEKSRIRPVVCINKIDLVDPAEFVPMVGVYSRMGYRVLLLSATTGFGIDRLRRTVKGCASVVIGQSGVGKSSLLNAIDPSLRLPIAAVSSENQKGRHTTTNARLVPLTGGGYVVDTPGMRHFQPWDIVPEEVVNFYRDLRVYVSRCKFSNCTHTHEAGCAIKNAVADGRLDERRYESYCYLRAGEME